MNKRYIYFVVGLIVLIIIVVTIIRDKAQQRVYETEIAAMANSPVTDALIKTSLESSNFAQANFGGKMFLAYEKLGQDMTGPKTTVYVWLVTQEYYQKDGLLKEGSGTSLPVALYFENTKLIAVVAPRDGSAYALDIQKIFPDRIKTMPIFLAQDSSGEIIERLVQKNLDDARNHFGTTVPALPHTPPSATSTPVNNNATTTEE